jgi:hypothetical protein
MALNPPIFKCASCGGVLVQTASSSSYTSEGSVKDVTYSIGPCAYCTAKRTQEIKSLRDDIAEYLDKLEKQHDLLLQAKLVCPCDDCPMHEDGCEKPCLTREEWDVRIQILQGSLPPLGAGVRLGGVS